MELRDAMQFSISGERIVCVTPPCGIDINDFLNIMRRVLSQYRAMPVKAQAEECVT